MSEPTDTPVETGVTIIETGLFVNPVQDFYKDPLTPFGMVGPTEVKTLDEESVVKYPETVGDMQYCNLLCAVAASREKFDEFVALNGGPRVDDGETLLAGRWIKHVPISAETLSGMAWTKTQYSPDLLIIGYPEQNDMYWQIVNLVKDRPIFESDVIDPTDIGLKDVA